MENTSFYCKELLDNLYSGAYIVDQDLKILYLNKNMENFTGYKSSELVGKSLKNGILTHIDVTGNPLYDERRPALKTIQNNVSQECEILLTPKNGHQILGVVKITPFKNTEGTIIGALEYFQEIPKTAIDPKKIQELIKLSFMDAITGLVNRKYTENKLNVLFIDLKQNYVPLGVLIFEINNYKELTEKQDVKAVNEALKIIASTLTNTVKNPHMILCRWSKNQFMLVYPNAKISFLNSYAHRLKELMEVSVLSMQNSNIVITLSVSGTMTRKEDSVESFLGRAEAILVESRNEQDNVKVADGNLKAYTINTKAPDFSNEVDTITEKES